jgi:hypothetical protein
MSEYRVQFEDHNGSALFVFLQTPNVIKASKVRDALRELNDSRALGHTIMARQFEYNSTTGEWEQLA